MRSYKKRNFTPTQSDLGIRTEFPDPVRQKMENAFGADFSGVQLYRSQAVADAGAEAIAMGNRIAFAPGKIDFSSSQGQSRLGHELSHVVSQARGESRGQGFLADTYLEGKADREGAMAAAGKTVYTGPVTPLSTFAGSGIMGTTGPMQAKKEKDKNQGEQFEDAYKEMDLSQKVKAMRDLSIGDIEDESLNNSYKKILSQIQKKQDKAFINELIRQQSEASQKEGEYYSSLKAQGQNGDEILDDDEAYMRAKYSDLSIESQGYTDLALSIGQNPDPRQEDMYDYYKSEVAEGRNNGTFNFFHNKASSFATNRRKEDKSFFGHNLWGEKTTYGEKYGIKSGNRVITNEEYLKNKMDASMKKYSKNRVIPQSKSRQNWLKKNNKKPMAPLTISDTLDKNDPVSKEWRDLSLATTSEQKDPKQLDKTYGILADQQKQNVTPEQHKQFDDYITNSTYLNGYLRSGEGENDVVKNRVKTLDEGMQTTGANLKAFRGVSDFALIAIIKQNPKLAKELLKTDKKTQELRVDYSKLEKDPTLLNGLEFSDEGYSSTSLSENFADKWRQGILKMDADKRTQNTLKEKFLKKDIEDQDSSLNFYNSQVSENEKVLKPEDLDKMSAEGQNTIYSNIARDHDGEYTPTTEEDLINSGMGSHLYDINVPQGTQGTLIDKMRYRDGAETDAGQKELLLGRGTRFKISGLKQLMDKKGVPLKNQFRIMMDVVGQDRKKVY